ncbi:MAG: hypothetical protein Q9157_004167 [Trypethelium eluteriae]
MSTVLPAPEQSAPANCAPPTAAKPPRVLACVRCQQRKVKCEACAQCVPAARTPSQRRRRFPERELLERLQRYESLLRRHNIQFDSLHAPNEEKVSLSEDDRGSTPAYDALSEAPVAETAVPSREKVAVKSEVSRDSEDDEDDSRDGHGDDDSGLSHQDLGRAEIRKTYDQLYKNNDPILFGSHKTNVHLSSLHPQQVQIFKLWQIYLENVNPLLKVTHTPTLQARIIDAASDVANISPTMEALMFSIYCVSIISLIDDDCRTSFGSPKEDLLSSYQLGCQQALLNCGFLRSGDRDCLTALYLYLVSARLGTDPRSLSSMLGIAIRIAQRMGIHDESTNAKCTALEAEMRRRLWWSLIMFDKRISEMSDYKTSIINPTWDCRIPINVNDSDIRSEMKTSPQGHERPTEVLFAVVRSELGEFIRHRAFYLDFTNPSMKSLAKGCQHDTASECDGLVALEKMIEDKYLDFCNQENPLHFMTMWTTRGVLSKYRFLEHSSRCFRLSGQQTDTQRDTAVSYALRILECDTKLMTSPLTKGYIWFVQLYFPMPEYIHIAQDLRKRPFQKHAEKSWEIMSDNYEARFLHMVEWDNPIFKIFSRLILQAWEVRAAGFRQSNKPLEPPRIVSNMKQTIEQIKSNAPDHNTEQPNVAVGMDLDDFSKSMPMDFGDQGLLYGMGGQGLAESGLMDYTDMIGQATMDVDVNNQLNWTTIDWNSMQGRGW